MVDSLTKAKRSWNMSQIRAKDTIPEKIVRSLLFRLGYRFVLHNEKLPGKPDIVLPKYKSVIFVHGCFWHLHSGCKDSNIPKSNVSFWKNKLFGNRKRDKMNIKKMKTIFGMKVLVIWECELKNINKLTGRIQKHLKNT